MTPRQRLFLITGLLVAFGTGYLAADWWERKATREPLPPPASVTPTPPGAGPPGVTPPPGALPQGVFPGPFPTSPTPEDPARQGDVLFGQGRYEEAIPFYRKALEANPKDADTWNDLGLALHYTGRSREALDALRRGSQISPPYQRIFLSLGFVAYRLGLHPEARSAWERAISLSPSTDVADEARKFLKEIK
ncbi:MAG: tetratricopeptide repeat protein [Candidatus Tectomicrobia bacterium]|nr:tetratricopeptide repeat protein [Candidatus Tectomicrobia bacterium]